MKLEIQLSEVTNIANQYLPNIISISESGNNLLLKVAKVGIIKLTFIKFENGKIYFKSINKIITVGIKKFLPDEILKYIKFGNQDIQVKIQLLIEDFKPDNIPNTKIYDIDFNNGSILCNIGFGMEPNFQNGNFNKSKYVNYIAGESIVFTFYSYIDLINHYEGAESGEVYDNNYYYFIPSEKKLTINEIRNSKLKLKEYWDDNSKKI